MQKHKHIKAFFFLGIFSILLLHQVVPHLHHLTDTEHTHLADTHSDNHQHDDAKKENSEKGFLDLFLEMHVHSPASNEIVVTQQSSLKQVKVKKDVKQAVSLLPFNRFINVENGDDIRVYYPPSNYFNSYLNTLGSRGPPTLG